MLTLHTLIGVEHQEPSPKAYINDSDAQRFFAELVSQSYSLTDRIQARIKHVHASWDLPKLLSNTNLSSTAKNKLISTVQIREILLKFA